MHPQLLEGGPSHHAIRTTIQTLISLTPKSVEPLLSTIFSPRSSSSSPKQKSLLLVMPDLDEAVDDQGRSSASAQHDWDESYDGLSWDGLARDCKEKDIGLSCVMIGLRGRGASESAARKKLRSLCLDVSMLSFRITYF